MPFAPRPLLPRPAPAVLGLSASAAEAIQPAPKNSSVATSEGYNMEGTKKQVGGREGGWAWLSWGLGARAALVNLLNNR